MTNNPDKPFSDNGRGRLSYDDFLRKVSIQDVLQDAGYQFYRRDGLKYPSFIRLGSDGRSQEISSSSTLVVGGVFSLLSKRSIMS